MNAFLFDSAFAGTASPEPALDFAAWTASQFQAVESALDRWVGDGVPEALAEPMRYAVLGGGKRLRPLLALAAARAVSAPAPVALRAACAVELIHAYSLVHDDMPCMDDDVLRRGKPTVHVRFGQAQALLAGDALQALAFELLTPEDGASLPASALAVAPAAADVSDAADATAEARAEARLDGLRPEVQARLCRLLARAAGGRGMAGGQAIDLASVGLRLSVEQLQTMHKLKTGALLQASVLMGAACGEPGPVAWQGLARYGAAIGLAFQVMDDVLDVTADTQTLGKTAGKDEARDKPTYVALMGVQAARGYAEQLCEEALEALRACALPQDAALQSLARKVVERSN